MNYKYNGRNYKVHQGPRNGQYINVKGKKHYINQKGDGKDFVSLTLKTPEFSPNADFYDNEMMPSNTIPNSGEYFYDGRNTDSTGRVTRAFDAVNYKKLSNNPVTRRNWRDENTGNNSRIRFDFANKTNDKSVNNAKHPKKHNDINLMTRQEIVDKLDDSGPGNSEVHRWYKELNVDSNDFWLNVLQKHYNKNVSYFSPDMARSLLGEKFGVIMGQWWPTSDKDFSKKNKIKNVEEMLVTDVDDLGSFTVETPNKRSQSKIDEFTIFDRGNDGKLCTGPQCDPIFVFLK